MNNSASENKLNGHKMKRNNIILFTGALLLAFTACKSIKEPEHVESYLDYTNDDVVQNEIHTIRILLETDSVKALWRACILKNQEIIKECADEVLFHL